MALIDVEQDWRAILAAEDEAIAVAAQRAAGPAPVDGGAVQAEPGTPLANLIGWMSDGPTAQVQPDTEG